jgi:hypothetical protein
MSRPVWQILLSWGLAVLVISGLLSFWIWTNQQKAAQERDRAQRQQDQAMCVMLDLFTSGPPPVSGPEGDRGRAVIKAMTDYRKTLDCG